MGLLTRWRQQRARRAGKRIDAVEERGRLRQWLLLAGRCESSSLNAPDATSLQPIYPPDDAFWADPFCWSRDGRFFVFFEELPLAQRRGHISAIALASDGRPTGEPFRVLTEPYHLSYPFLFERDGELYMVPEKRAAKRVDLYRCVQFPEQWEYVRTLLDGMALADPTLFEHDGRWWLFCAAASGRMRVNESLVAFYADDPLSDRWVAHRGNPLVRDFSRGRPAGRVFRHDSGALLRPSQNCVRRYGYGLNLGEIVALSPTHYEERLVWHTNGVQGGGWRGLHHLDWHRGVIVMDAQRLIPETATRR
jgi:hypothetical protein